MKKITEVFAGLFFLIFSRYAEAAVCALNPVPDGATISVSCSMPMDTLLTIDNGGRISTSSMGALLNNFNSTPRTGSLLNNGVISTAETGVNGLAIFNQPGNRISSLVNNGEISSGYRAIQNQGAITSLINSGTISTTNGSQASLYNAVGSIGTLTNVGTINKFIFSGPNLANGVIGTMNNLQGSGNSAGALRVYQRRPNNYNIIINNTGYGRLYSYGIIPIGNTMAFNIYGNTGTTLVSGVAASTIAPGTYYDVLGGFTDLSGVTGATGTYGGYSYSLVANTGSAGYWNLLVTAPTFDMSGVGTIYQSSSLGVGVVGIFSGGTLQVSSAGTIANNFSIDATNGVVDQSGLASNFTGVISDTVNGTPGSLTIANTGTGGSVQFSAANTYTGSTAINSGATLALVGSGAVATSSGVVNNGSFDVSATTSGASVRAISGSGTTELGAKNLTVINATGDLSGSISGTGGLNISGGNQTLSGSNTFSGGVQVQSGAELTIPASSALGSGPLSLVGSSTVPATINITGTTTIANSISVAGDPVFNIAAGTTTTISAPITDGVASGDVVVAGGGSLNLTAANTYTGSTAINSGATLALVGSGSITPSASVANSGTLSVANKTGNVALGGSFTQTSTGTLIMGFSPASNQRLAVAGGAALAGTLSLSAVSGNYSAGKYTLLTANGVTGKFSAFNSNLGTYTNLAYSLSYDANYVYLDLFANGPSLADTQQSLVNTASVLQNTFTLQNTVLANSFSYDCNVFGANNVCVSAGGRNTAVSAANGFNNTSALLIAAYRVMPSVRVGAYADQNLSVNNAGSTVSLGNNTPLIGLFGAWNERLDGTGTEVKVSAAYGQKNTTVTRQVVGTSEAGSGSSQLNSQGAQVTAKYGFGVIGNVIVAPYIGIRYTQNNMGGYTEGTSATVTAPLTYSALNTNATTALAGLGTSYKFISRAGVFGSVGVETDTNTANGTYSATGVTGLTPVNFNANPVKTRPTAMLGVYFDVEKNQRLGVTGIYRQEPFQAVSTTTVMATYTLGM